MCVYVTLWRTVSATVLAPLADTNTNNFYASVRPKRRGKHTETVPKKTKATKQIYKMYNERVDFQA